MPPAAPTDPRLLGTWRSDRLRTFRHFRPKPRCRPVMLRKLKALFGRLTVTWEADAFHTELDGFAGSYPYEVLASDATSVVIAAADAISGERQLRHIHFEGEFYWLPVGGHMTEWFRRVPPLAG